MLLSFQPMRALGFAAVVSLLVPFLPGSAGTLTSSQTRTSSQDLEVFDIRADGSVSAPRYYRYEQLLTLRLVTVKTAKDPNTQQPATYTGVYFNDLIPGLQSSAEQTVLGANCYDGYQQYYDPDYDEKHHPIFLLKYDGKAPAEWPKSEHVSVELTSYALSLGKFDAPDPHNSEVMKGQKIAVGSCVSCHNNGSAGGKMAQRPWQVLAANAVYNSDYFRQYVVDPQKFKPNVAMPAHPTFDSATLDALQTYFKTVLPGG